MEGGETPPGLIDQLKDRLYRRGAFRSDVSRAKFSLPRNDSSANFEAPVEAPSTMLTPSFLKKFFAFSILFFALAVGAAAFIILTGSNVVSSNNLDIAIKGPVSAKGGEEIPLAILIANNNPTALEAVDLSVAFPPGTREAGKLDRDFTRYQKNLGTLASGESHTENIRAVLFASAGSEQEIKVTVDYRTVGSNAIFEKTKSYKVLLTSSPLEVAVTVPEELSSGSDIALALDLSTGNSDGLANVLVEVNYPSGFKFVGAVPKPAYGNNIWDIGDLGPDAKRHITINGVLEGQDGEKKLFRFTAGVPSSTREDRVGVPYNTTESTIQMRRSFVELVGTINGSTEAEVVTNPATTLRADLSWKNNLSDKILHGQVNVKISGNALDQASVALNTGTYRSTDDVVQWSEQHEEDLAIVESGASGHVNFDFAPLSTLSLSGLGIKNPYIDLDLSFDGVRVGEGSSGSAVHTGGKKRIKINSKLDLVARGVYSQGPFVNNGPLPPRANVETSYTLVWSLVNTSNDLDSVRVSAILPSNVRYIGTVSPAGSDVRYDSLRGELVWNIGRLPTNTSGAPVKELSFQVGLTPSVPQAGQTLPLVTNVKVTGTDTWTAASLSDSVSLVDMHIATDPNFKEEWSKVAP